MKIFWSALLLAAALAVGAAAPANAQNYPTKAITVVVPFPAGALDIFPRFVQVGMEKDLGQTIIVDVKPGANGFIGTEYVMRAPPDGYTILFNAFTSIVMGPLVSPEAKFDVERDFVPISGLVNASWVLIVRKGLPVNSLAEFIAYAKANPGKVTFGSSGLGSTPHVLGATFARAIGAEMNHVPYRSIVQTVQAVGGGEVDCAITAPGFARASLARGDVKLLGFDGVPLASDFPKVPDLTKEVPGFETLDSPTGYWAPAKTPKAIVDRFNKALRVAAELPDVRAKLLDAGQTIIVGSPEEFGAMIAKNVAASKKLVGQLRAAGVKFE